VHISDDIKLGPTFLPDNPQFLTSGNPAPMEKGFGPMGRVFLFDTVPIALATNNIATAQAVAGALPMVLSLTPGAGVTLQFTNPDGIPRWILDVPRAVSVTAAAANTATVTVRGYDQYGYAMTETLAAPSTSTVTGKKAFKTIVSATTSAAAGSNLSLGTSDKLGMPMAVIDAAYLGDFKYNNVLAADAGTFVAADATTPATATTGDVRGTYTPSSATNGAKRLACLIGMPANQVGPQATNSGVLGVAQFAG
jgi:hypothetical protein